MQIVSGNNLYHQWFCDDLIISNFRPVTAESLNNLDFNTAELIQVNWFYNIIKIQNSFYLIGFINSGEKIRKIKLPENCDCPDTIVVGNDYILLIVNKKSHKIWVYNLEDWSEYKCVSLTVEGALEKSSEKKKKLENLITNVSLFNDSLLYLTETGNIYCGLLPSYIDTTHCMGKVIDIQCGYEHFMLLTDAGYVYTWGNGR